MFYHILIIGSALLGVIFPLIISQILISRKEENYKTYKSFKSELDNLTIEKSIALEAIGKINQSFIDKKISGHERDKLLLKYHRLLDHYNKRILKIKPIVDIKDIYEYRNQIYSFLSDSVYKIDKKLAEFSNQFNYVNQNIKDKNNTDSIGIDKVNKSFELTKLFLEKSETKDLKSESSNKEIFPADSNFLDDKDETAREENHNSVTINDKEIGSEDINKIQNDVLKILQRLDKPSFNL